MTFKMIKKLFPVVCRLFAFYGILLLFFLGCARVKPPPTPSKRSKPYKIGKKWYKPIPHARGFRQHGQASWYGKKFHGGKTANGEIYNMYAMTAAHKTLPFNTNVKVDNLKNGKNINVRINDRGPFVRGRIIDLSYEAAKKLGIVGSGTAPVEIVAIGGATKQKSQGRSDSSYKSVNYYQGNFTVQVGAFSDLKNAKRLKQKLSRLYKNVHITTHYDGYDKLHKVRVGRWSTLEQAAKYEKIMIKDGFVDAFVIAKDN